MNWFQKKPYTPEPEESVPDPAFLEAQTDGLIDAYDKAERYRQMYDLPRQRRLIESDLVEAASRLWKWTMKQTHPLYRYIQILEADYAEAHSELDDKLLYAKARKEERLQRLEHEREALREEVDATREQLRAIEQEYNRAPHTKAHPGSLRRIPMWMFWLIMLVAGAAEISIYHSVFLSQEVRIGADIAKENKYLIDLAAYGMASGFTLMIIWMAHMTGSLLRHFHDYAKERRLYYVKLGLILAVVGGAIVSTVVIRGQMFDILAKEQQVAAVKELREKQGNLTFDDSDDLSAGEETSQQATASQDDLFGGEALQPETDGALVDDAARADAEQNVQDAREAALRDEINREKGGTAWLFTLINLFIFFGGVFLSYAAHTSSEAYEALEALLKRRERALEKVERAIRKAQNNMVQFREKELNRLFQKLLRRAAAYDREVRTYNAYLNLFEMKMDIVQEHLLSAAEAAGCDTEGIDWRTLTQETIRIDRRSELQHVNNLEAFLIYKEERRHADARTHTTPKENRE
jgi:hypothetical protein